MAKHRDDEEQTPSNVTSGGKVPDPAKGPASRESGKAEGTAVYPPSPSDSAGEKTDNVPPSKKLPPDVPESENPPARKQVPTASQALAQADAETARLRAENEELKRQVRSLGGIVEGDQTGSRLMHAGPMRKARVTPVGGSPMVVEIPADTPEKDAEAAAINAWKERAGIWSVAQQPFVEYDVSETQEEDDEETPAKRARKKG